MPILNIRSPNLDRDTEEEKEDGIIEGEKNQVLINHSKLKGIGRTCKLFDEMFVRREIT